MRIVLAVSKGLINQRNNSHKIIIEIKLYTFTKWRLFTECKDYDLMSSTSNSSPPHSQNWTLSIFTTFQKMGALYLHHIPKKWEHSIFTTFQKWEHSIFTTFQKMGTLYLHHIHKIVNTLCFVRFCFSQWMINLLRITNGCFSHIQLFMEPI